jgi:hypothetical protein
MKSKLRKIFFILCCAPWFGVQAQYDVHLEIGNLGLYIAREMYFEDVWKLDREILKNNKVSKVTYYDYGDVLRKTMDINKEGYVSLFRKYEGSVRKDALHCGNSPDTMIVFYDEHNRIVKMKTIPTLWGFGDFEYNLKYNDHNLVSLRTSSDGKLSARDTVYYLDGKTRGVGHFYSENQLQPIFSGFYYSPDTTHNWGKPEIGGDYEIYAHNKDSIAFTLGTAVRELTVLKNKRIASQYIGENYSSFGPALYEYFYKPDGLIKYVKITDRFGFTHSRFYEYEYYSE